MNNRTAFYILALCTLITSCKPKAATEEDAGAAPGSVVTPVTVTNPEKGNMSETVQVNAVSAFLLKTYAKAVANGYLEKVNVKPGLYVTKGETLFIIKTKEAQALGNLVNRLDTSLHFEGTIAVKSPGNGYITQLTFTAGNYVQDGEQLAEITDSKSFVFILDLPYELKPYLPLNSAVELHLADSTVLNGVASSVLPTVDSVSQTQRFIIQVNSSKAIPANVLAKVNITKSQKINTVSLPKAAVLSDEVQANFWIMKMINDSVAVKVPVTKGLETKTSVEIVSPPLSPADKILLTGNYGLPDTANVKLVKE